MAEAIVIPTLITVAWITVVTTIIGACRAAACADAAEDDLRRRSGLGAQRDAQCDESSDDGTWWKAAPAWLESWSAPADPPAAG